MLSSAPAFFVALFIIEAPIYHGLPNESGWITRAASSNALISGIREVLRLAGRGIWDGGMDPALTLRVLWGTSWVISPCPIRS